MGRPLRVLVLDIADAPYALAIARSLGNAGHRVVFGLSEGSLGVESESRFCAETWVYPDPTNARPEFQQALIRTAASYDAIVPAMEPTLLATATVRAQIEAEGALLPIADAPTLERATRKLEILRLAEKLGLPTPRTIVADRLPDLAEVREALGSPFVMKSSSEVGLRPVERHYLVGSTDQGLWPSRFGALATRGPVILQQYVTGTGAGVGLLYNREGSLVAYSGHRRRVEQFADGGPSLLATTEENAAALAHARRLLETLGWKGVAMVEFRLDAESRPILMEVNPRFWGTVPLAIASGVDVPRLLLETYATPWSGPPLHPSRRRTYFSIEATLTGMTSPRDKRPRVGPLLAGLARSLGGLTVRELQFRDLGPDWAHLRQRLRGRASRHRVARLGPFWFGAAQSYAPLVREGVRTVIDLREPAEVARAPLNLPAGVERISFPIEDDHGIAPSGFETILPRIESAVREGPVYVHCRQGMGRAPMVAVGYLVWTGHPLADAFGRVFAARPATRLKPPQRAALATFAHARSARSRVPGDFASPG
jgi:biotin carboxylase